MTGQVRTVLGDIPAATLGRTDYHEHLFQVTPLLAGDELDDEERSGAEARLLRKAGIDAIIEATPTGLGRDPAATARISEHTGLRVVATTGAHREAHYAADHWLRALGADGLAERFIRDVAEALPARDGPSASEPALTPAGEPVRAGLIKAGIGYWTVSRFERGVLDAVAAAHRASGAPIMVHLEHGSAALEVVEILQSAGVAADRVVLAHIDRNPDPGVHAEVAAAGAYLGYDGIARTRDWPDSLLIDCLLRVAELGGAERILLGGDVARSSRCVAYGGMPGLAYLPARFVPRLERAGGAALVRTVLVDNPARFLSGTMSGVQP
jgi:5-phospho-D-xylono-1,4-lactonase